MKDPPACAPGSSKVKGTCYSHDSLKKIARSLNSSSPSRVVPEEGKATTIWSALKNALKTRCENERCWAEQPFVSIHDRTVLLDSFRPHAPREWEQNERAWLSNFDIDAVMRQYEKKNKNFDFLGVVPVDFAQRLHANRCVVSRMCDFDVNELAEKGKTKLGCVVNLDPHDQKGSHWVAFFISLKGKNRGTYFYDSIARSPPRMIADFMESVVAKVREKDPGHPYRHNTVRRQYKNTECGVFCLKFIEEMLGGRRCFDDVCDSIPYDDETFLERRRYFDYTG